MSTKSEQKRLDKFNRLISDFEIEHHCQILLEKKITASGTGNGGNGDK